MCEMPVCEIPMFIAGMPKWLILVIVCCVGMALYRFVVRMLGGNKVFPGVVVMVAVLVAFCAAIMVAPGSVGNFRQPFTRVPASHTVRPPRPPDLDFVEQQIAEITQLHEFAAAKGLDAARKHRSEAPELHRTEAYARSPNDDDSGDLTIVHGPGGVVLATITTNAGRSTERLHDRFAPHNFHRRTGSSPASTALTAIAIAAFLAVGYVFFDAATRGQFTWRLRMFAVVAFAAICVALQYLHQQL